MLFSPRTDTQGNESPFSATKDFISIISDVIDCTICREYSPIYSEEIDAMLTTSETRKELLEMGVLIELSCPISLLITAMSSCPLAGFPRC